MALAVAGCGSGSGAAAGGKPSEYKVGIAAALTGSYAESLGLPMKQGAQLAIDEINKAGGINGVKIAPTYVDTKGDSTTGAVTMQKLVSITKTPFVISNLTNVVAAQGPIANRNKALLVNAAAQSSSLGQIGPYVWTARPYAEVELALLTSEFASKYPRLAIITTDDASGHGQATALSKYWAQAGGKVVSQQFAPPNSTQFASYIDKIQTSSPSALFIGSYGPDVALTVKQTRASGLKVPILSYSGFETPDLIKVAGAAANGATYTEPIAIDPKTNQAQAKFAQEYQSRFHSAPNAYSYLHYDAVKQIFAGLVQYLNQHHLDYTGENLQTALTKHGVFGGGLTGPARFTSDRQALKPVSIFRVENGAFKLVKVESLDQVKANLQKFGVSTSVASGG